MNSKTRIEKDENGVPVGQLIKEKRLRLQMTQMQLADALGMSKYGCRSIRGWEKGENIPSLVSLNRILNIPENIPFPNIENARYKLVDLFAGIGGNRLGFYKTEAINVVFSSEIDKFVAKTYKANFGETPYGDITKIDTKSIPDHDILVGDFSIHDFKEIRKKININRFTGTLFYDIAKIIKEKKPKVFLLESDKKLEDHKRDIIVWAIETLFKEFNYCVYSSVFNAKDFGIPQNRERIYIVGFDMNSVLNYNDFTFPTPDYSKTCVSEILESKVSEKYTLSNKLWQNYQNEKTNINNCLFNKNSEYTNTINAWYRKNYADILIEQENKNPRKITPREAARLQGFPDNFIIPVSDTQSYKQFGDSTAVPVIYAIAKKIIELLDKNTK
ncbi:DNA (cytosine-5-)-methyltransferase [Mycoplasmopsis caviae]|uniref:DNA (cytosine-5-)-methyltransferase n=1 Tax=Mycoplasmopsis caviae TaxID=55603 RepID=A0A3P8LAL5_9BACT|nr:DNA (cytosine-5-)-methyltransferase [Mycoplasmopsis caviae]UUD35382.1 DNA (cytosine-5-)-methyltransferase [Mycoplasmopsis caviae]VDR41841.1 cytosine-specific methyltransferase [Mycoplasmopsis caviae]